MLDLLSLRGCCFTLLTTPSEDLTFLYTCLSINFFSAASPPKTHNDVQEEEEEEEVGSREDTGSYDVLTPPSMQLPGNERSSGHCSSGSCVVALSHSPVMCSLVHV